MNELKTCRITIGAKAQQTRKTWLKEQNSHNKNLQSESDQDLSRDKVGQNKIIQLRVCADAAARAGR